MRAVGSSAGDLTINGLDATPTAIRLLASGASVACQITGGGLRVTLPALPADGLAHARAIDIDT